MITDRLKLNDDKTEFVIIGTRAQLDKVIVSDNVVRTVRDLGTWLI